MIGFDPIEPLFRFVPKKKDVVKLYERAIYFDPDGSTIEIPSGVESDLASIPRFCQRVLPKLDLHRMAAILHDYLYQLCGNLPDGRRFTRDQCDQKFLEAMTSLGVSAWKRQAMYRAVRMFGGIAWGNHLRRRQHAVKEMPFDEMMRILSSPAEVDSKDENPK
jgi:hypothetical protein